jgi:hypothetical protein
VLRIIFGSLTSSFLKALRTLRNAELPDTRLSDWFFGAKRLANHSSARSALRTNRSTGNFPA